MFVFFPSSGGSILCVNRVQLEFRKQAEPTFIYSCGQASMVLHLIILLALDQSFNQLTLSFKF